MKKRIFSIITALALCLTLLPTVALADSVDDKLYPYHQTYKELSSSVGQLTLGSNTIAADTYYLVGEGGSLTESSDGDYNLYYSSGELTLKDAKLNACLYVPGDTEIVLVGENISGSADAPIDGVGIVGVTLGNITITGDGSYTVYSTIGGIVTMQEDKDYYEEDEEGNEKNPGDHDDSGIIIDGTTLALYNKDGESIATYDGPIIIRNGAKVTAGSMFAAYSRTALPWMPTDMLITGTDTELTATRIVCGNVFTAESGTKVTVTTEKDSEEVAISSDNGIEIQKGATVTATGEHGGLTSLRGSINIAGTVTAKMTTPVTQTDGYAAVSAGAKPASNCSVTVTGTLNIESAYTGIWTIGTGDITIDGGEVSIVAVLGIMTRMDAQTATGGGNLTIQNKGKLTITRATMGTYPLASDCTLTVDNSTVDISSSAWGLYWLGPIKLKDSTVTCANTASSNQAIGTNSSITYSYSAGYKFLAGDSADSASEITTDAQSNNLKDKYVKIQPCYAVTVENGSPESTTAAEGETVTIKANDASDGQQFAYWTSSNNNVIFVNETAAETSFTMPDSAVSVTANYKWTAPDENVGYSIDYDEETITINSGYEVSANQDFTSTISSGDAVTPGSTLYIRKAASDGTLASDAQSLTVPARPAAPNDLAIDTAAESVTVSADYYYNTASGGYTDNGWTQGTDSAVTVTPGSSIYIYKAAVTTEGQEAFKSAVQTLTAPARPDAPTGVQGQNETVDGKADGKITGVTTDMEYKLSTASEWTACTGTEVTGLAPGMYQVRIAATNDSFASTAASVEIASGDEKTYTLNVTAPTFDAAAYGYVQPAAQSITISNSGNSASAISGVALSGDTSAFALNKTGSATVQPGKSDTSYTIQPADGLNTGTYTATITVTYQGSMTATATATVSFTVTPAAQDAPDAPEAKSKTYNRVTLETVEDNANGAAAEYGISADGGETWTWQDSPEFTGLSASTTYTFAVRYGAVDNYNASDASPTAEITTSARSSGGSSSSPTYTPTVERDDNGSTAVRPKNPKQGDKVTITPKPDAGYEVDSVTVTGKNGKTVKVTDNGDGTYSFIQPASKVTVEVTFTEIQKPVEKLPFTDVPESAYYYDAVKWAVENGVTGGTTATTFSPDAPCTRAQAVTFLWRAAGSPEPVSANCPFTDIQPGDYYYKAVLWAVENGITAGTSATTFSPNSTVTRGQTVTFLYRTARAAATGSNPFTDVADSAYYHDPVRWAVENGVTAGTSATTFSPDAPCTRGQIVTFLYRVYG